jgi:hypothetical protein
MTGTLIRFITGGQAGTGTKCRGEHRPLPSAPTSFARGVVPTYNTDREWHNTWLALDRKGRRVSKSLRNEHLFHHEGV